MHSTRSILGLLAVLLAIIPATTAQSCSSSTQAFGSSSNYGGAGQCIPTGYFQAQDLGQTTTAALTTQCRAQCVAFGAQCQGFAGELMKAADSSLTTGQCFFYTSLPAKPATCANYPSIILAETKDNTPKCLSSSASVATSFCSSYLKLGTVTSYTTTVTPLKYVFRFRIELFLTQT
jgi:hypothetical protein